MKDQFKKITTTIKPASNFLVKHLAISVFMIFMIIYVVLVLKINQFTSAQPTVLQVSAKENSIQQPKIDQQTLAKIQQLQNQNIQVQALFEQARNNPFSE